MNSVPKIGINGFGRMGFCALRLCMERNWPVVAINANRSATELKTIFKYDSAHGKFYGSIEIESENVIIINGNRIVITNEREPKNIPWGFLGAEMVIDCTGKFTSYSLASGHLIAGAKKVILSSPIKDDSIPMFVMGVNEKDYTPDINIVSNASCTTNCLAPLSKVLNDAFGIDLGLMTTVHAVTNTQNTVDGHNSKDMRLARAMTNIIPSSTGAAKAVGKVIPELDGKLTGRSLRVPVPDGSIVDLTVILHTSTTYEEICKVVKEAAEGYMNGIIEYSNEPIVSSDIIGNKNPCVFDATAGIEMSNKFFKLFAWYDNEYSYMSKLLDLLEYISK